MCAHAVPGTPFGSAKAGAGRLVLVRAGAAEGYAEGTLLGTRDDALSTLGRVHSQKTAELLMDLQARSITLRALLGLMAGQSAWPSCMVSRMRGEAWQDLSRGLRLQVSEVLSSPLSRAQETARTVADLQALAGYGQPPVSPMEGLNNRDWGSLEGRSAAEARLMLLWCCMQLCLLHAL